MLFAFFVRSSQVSVINPEYNDTNAYEFPLIIIYRNVYSYPRQEEEEEEGHCQVHNDWQLPESQNRTAAQDPGRPSTGQVLCHSPDWSADQYSPILDRCEARQSAI